MTTIQQRAVFLSDVMMTAIEKYKFNKSIESFPPFNAERRDEIERLISIAVYTALVAEASCSDLPSSQLFVDKFAELTPKWSKPPEKIKL
jgi:hypothetical protein